MQSKEKFRLNNPSWILLFRNNKMNYFCTEINNHLKRILSLCFLLVFLFPLVEKGIHDANHLDDAHCVATDKHFHSLEHTCPICDYTITHNSITPETDSVFIISIQEFTFLPFVQNHFHPTPFLHLPARAPPFIC